MIESDTDGSSNQLPSSFWKCQSFSKQFPRTSCLMVLCTLVAFLRVIYSVHRISKPSNLCKYKASFMCRFECACMRVNINQTPTVSLFSNSPDVVVDAGGLSLALSPAASCPASVSNSLSCLITVADEHVCTGTADSVWKKIYLTSSCPRLFPATGGFFLLLL